MARPGAKPTQSQIDDIYMNILQSRPNMLDAAVEQAALKARGPNISRLLYAGKIPEDKQPETSKDRVVGWHESTMKGAGLISRMAGFLMVYPTCVVHLLEAETPTLMHVVKALRGEGKLEPILEGVCILSFTEMVQLRAWPAWMNVYIKSENLGPYDEFILEDFNVVQKIIDININILKCGRIFTDVTKDEWPAALESLRATVEDLLIYDPNEIWALMQAEKTPKLNDFWQLMTEPPVVSFDSAHKIWPMMDIPIRVLD